MGNDKNNNELSSDNDDDMISLSSDEDDNMDRMFAKVQQGGGRRTRKRYDEDDEDDDDDDDDDEDDDEENDNDKENHSHDNTRIFPKRRKGGNNSDSSDDDDDDDNRTNRYVRSTKPSTTPSTSSAAGAAVKSSSTSSTTKFDSPTRGRKLTLQERLEERSRQAKRRCFLTGKASSGSENSNDEDDDDNVDNNDENDDIGVQVTKVMIPPQKEKSSIATTESVQSKRCTRSSTRRSTRSRGTTTGNNIEVQMTNVMIPPQKEKSIATIQSLQSKRCTRSSARRTTRSRGTTTDTTTTTKTNAPRSIIELLSDSSDDDDHRPLSGFSSQDLQFQRARNAASNLRKAQLYHAEDVVVPTTTPSKKTTTLTTSNTTSHKPLSASAAAAESLGDTIKITVRDHYHQQAHANGNSTSAVKETVITMRQNEQLQLLKERYLQSLNLSPSSASVTFKFHSQTLIWTRTPAQYGIQSGNFVDAVLKVIGMSAKGLSFAGNNTTAGPNLGKSIELKLRTRREKPNSQPSTKRARTRQKKVAAATTVIETTEKFFSIRMQETFESLRNKVLEANKLNITNCEVSFHFDGQKISLNATPTSLDMEDQDLVDVNIKE